MEPRYPRWLGGFRCNPTDSPDTDGILLKREAQWYFLENSGLAGEIRAEARQRGTASQQALRLRRGYRACPLDKDLCQYICSALPDLGARTVMVRSEKSSESGLSTIPAVFAAVRRAWLSTDFLKQQLEAASRGEEIPTWPVVIQRETGDVPGFGPRGWFGVEPSSRP